MHYILFYNKFLSFYYKITIILLFSFMKVDKLNAYALPFSFFCIEK